METKSNAMTRALEDPVSRRKFVALAGGGGSLALLLAACGSSNSSTTASTSSTASGAADNPLAQFGEGDLGVVNYALTLEYLESAFYAQVVKSGLFKGAQQDLIKTFASDEDQHVQALTATAKQLGGKPAPIPKVMFDTSDAATVLSTAATVENLGASAYLGAAGLIKSPDVLAAALSIHTVEGRHAAALNTLTKQTITPDGAFAKPADPATVLAAVKPFIVA
jgi:hypothetical protein